MNKQAETQVRRAEGKSGRPWWQWVVGVGLIVGAATHWWMTARPGMTIVRMNLPPRPVRLSPELTEADALPAEPGSLAGFSLLLVTLDTTRADRLGCYGNEDIETPNLDRLAADGVIFSQAVATAPTTLPAHASIMTGLYPYHHGARFNGLFHLDEAHTTLAEVLAAEGYSTAAAVSAYVLDGRYGLIQGFESFDDDMTGEPAPAQFRYPERNAQRTTDRAVDWLKGAGEGPFFLWVHYFDPHGLYQPPSPYAEQYEDNLYDGEIAYMDHELGRLLGTLDGLGLADRTLVVVVGDHGEAVGWRHEATHGHLVYEVTIQIPLIMRCPTRLTGGVNLTRRASQVDLMPTVLSLLGVPQPGGLDGADLTAKPNGDRPIFVENLQPWLGYGWAPQAAVYYGPHKYIWAPNDPELYDVASDPLEANELRASKPEVAAALKAKLSELFGPNLEAALTARPTHTPSGDEARKLQALGYIVSAVNLPPVDSCPNAKDMLPVLNEVENVIYGYLPTGDVGEACTMLEEIRAKHPDFLPLYKYLGFLYRQEGRLDDAEEAFRECLRIFPGSLDAMGALAVTLGMKGDNDGAMQVLEQIVAARPRHFDGRSQLGRLLLEEGRASEAADHLAVAFNVNPTDRTCLKSMMQAFVTSSRVEDVRRILRQKLEEQPQLSAARLALAQNLIGEEGYSEALDLLREGAELMPDDTEAVSNFALMLAQIPDAEFRAPYDAVSLMEKLCQRTGYADPQALFRLATVYSVVGRYDEALAIAEKARTIAAEAGDKELVAALTNLIAGQARAKEAGGAPQPGATP